MRNVISPKLGLGGLLFFRTMFSGWQYLDYLLLSTLVALAIHGAYFPCLKMSVIVDYLY